MSNNPELGILLFKQYMFMIRISDSVKGMVKICLSPLLAVPTVISVSPPGNFLCSHKLRLLNILYK